MYMLTNNERKKDMNDRELLELAAKAAGHKHVDYSDVDYDGNLGIVLVDEIGRDIADWSPLIDDGDALRLANELNLSITRRGNAVFVVGDDYSCTRVEYGQDLNAATRLAIVRTAALIGEKMFNAQKSLCWWGKMGYKSTNSLLTCNLTSR